MTRATVLALLAVPALAAAAPPISISTSVGAQVVTERSYDLVDQDDHLTLWRVDAGWRFPVARGELEASLGVFTGGTEATLHERTNAQLWLRGLEAAAVWRYPLARVIEPYARLGAGLDWSSLSLRNQGPTISQTALGLFATAALGTQLVARLGENGQRALVLDLGVGYAWRQRHDYRELRPEQPTGADAIAFSSLPAGTLNLSGITYRVGLALRF
jgi:hypothetical protein